MIQPILIIKTFGNFQVRLDNLLLQWPTQKSKLLLQLLLLEPGVTVKSERLMDLLWPDLTPGSAKSNLWVTVSQLRRVFEPNLPSRGRSAYIQKSGDGYRFSPEADYQLDSEVFTTLLRQAQSSPKLGDRIPLWEQAIQLYRGDYLAEELYAEWLFAARYQWQQNYLQLLTSLSETHISFGQFEQAESYCRQYLKYDDLSETVSRMLMFCLSQQGKRSAALAHYKLLTDKLATELGVEPLPDTHTLAQQIKAGQDIPLTTPQTSLRAKGLSFHAPLVGRDAQLAQLREHWAAAEQGQGHILLVEGEAGVGKSRLAGELTSLVNHQGAHVLQARCYEIEQGLAYQPLIDLMRQAATLGTNTSLLPSVWQRELAVILPDFTRTDDANAHILIPITEDSQQSRLYQAIFQFLITYARNGPIAIILDDIQWADTASLGFLHYLARQSWQDRILLLCTYRSDEVAVRPELAQLVTHLNRQTNVTYLELKRLSATEVSDFVRQSLPEVAESAELANWLYRETDGNPFFLTSLIQSLHQENRLQEPTSLNLPAGSTDHQLLELPAAISTYVRSRLVALSAQERQLLERLAVYGRSLSFPRLAVITGQAQMILLDSLERLLSRQLLVESDDHYHFSHDKIREVLYRDLSGARRLVYHSQIAKLLASEQPGPEVAANIAYHYEQAGDEDKAVSYWLAAGQHDLAVFALSQAIVHFQNALSFAKRAEARIEAYDGLGRGYMLLEESEASVAIFREGIALARHEQDLQAEAKLLFGLAQNLSRRHRPDASITEIQAALKAAEAADDNRLRVQSLLLLTESLEASGDLKSALETVSKADALSKETTDPRLQSQTLLESAFINTLLADFDNAIAQTNQALNLRQTTHDEPSIAYAWNILGRGYGGRGSYSESFKAFSHCQSIAERIGDGYLIAMMPNMQGWLHRELGDYEAAVALDGDGVTLAQQWQKSPPEISARLNVCHDLLALDNVTAARKMLAAVESQI